MITKFPQFQAIGFVSRRVIRAVRVHPLTKLFRIEAKWVDVEPNENPSVQPVVQRLLRTAAVLHAETGRIVPQWGVIEQPGALVQTPRTRNSYIGVDRPHSGSEFRRKRRSTRRRPVPTARKNNHVRIVGRGPCGELLLIEPGPGPIRATSSPQWVSIRPE